MLSYWYVLTYSALMLYCFSTKKLALLRLSEGCFHQLQFFIVFLEFR
jgi:hypothetical protein